MYVPITFDYPDKLCTIISGSENRLSQTGTESDISTIKSTGKVDLQMHHYIIPEC